MESLVSRAKHKIQWSFWKTLKEKMEQEGFELLNNEEITASSTKTYNYYAGRSKSVIGLFYPVMDVEDGKIYWGAEIEDNLYSGFTIITSGENRKVSDQKMYAKYRDMVQSLNSDYKIDSPWWLGWKYTEPQLNFKSFNSDLIFALADEQQLKTFVNKIVCEVKKEIEELKKCDNL
ncbi:hypothetical protein LJC53_07735 [Bacteroidales bacterium OttesenSCG-928-C03]|nr:hypothetical protein [Bacteroidales bacterium OttesenSCG-928-C03]